MVELTQIPVNELKNNQIAYLIAKLLGYPTYVMEHNWPGNARVHEEQLEQTVCIIDLQSAAWLNNKNRGKRFQPHADKRILLDLLRGMPSVSFVFMKTQGEQAKTSATIIADVDEHSPLYANGSGFSRIIDNCSDASIMLNVCVSAIQARYGSTVAVPAAIVGNNVHHYDHEFYSEIK